MPLDFLLLTKQLVNILTMASILDKIISSHFGRLFQAHDVQNTGCYICQNTFLYFGLLVLCNIDERNGIKRMGGIGRTILIDSEVSIAMICNDNCLVTSLQYSLDYLTNTCIHSSNSLLRVRTESWCLLPRWPLMIFSPK